METQVAERTNQRTKRGLPRVAFGVFEVAEALGVSQGFIRLEITRGRLKTFRVGRRVLVKKDAFDEYVAGC